MTREPPPPDEVTQQWWAATREHRLLLQRCGGCGAMTHPPRALCPSCGSMNDLRWEEACGLGVVDACTVVERAPQAGFAPPYVVARVRLREGPVVLTNVVAHDPYSVGIGDPVRLGWEALSDGRALPVFRPGNAKE